MPMPLADQAQPAALPNAVTVRAVVGTAIVVTVLAGAALAMGLAPAGTDLFVGVGVATAVLAAAVATIVHGRLTARSRLPASATAGRTLATQIQLGLGLGFLAKLLGLLLGTGILLMLEVKFAGLAAFAVAFAAASLLLQVGIAAMLGRALRRRDANRAGTSTMAAASAHTTDPTT